MRQQEHAHQDEQHIGITASAPAHAADVACNRIVSAASTDGPKARSVTAQLVTFSKPAFVDKQTKNARKRLRIWNIYERKGTMFNAVTHEPLCKRASALGQGTQASVYSVQPAVQCSDAAISKCFSKEDGYLAVKSYKRGYAIKEARMYELNNAVELRKSNREVSNLDQAMDNVNEISYEHVHWLRNKANGDVIACVRRGMNVRQLSLEACFHLFGISDPVLHDVKPMIKDLVVAAARNQLDAFENKYGLILPTNFLSLLLRRQKFYAKEPMCMARCQGHQNVCGIYGIFEEVTPSSIRFNALMPCYSGGELFSFIDQKWPRGMPENLAKEIFRQIVQALKHCKDHGLVVHRDVKLENVLLRKKPVAGEKVEIVLADFGLSMLAKKTDKLTRSWMSTARVGTPQYWAPELWPVSVSTINSQSIDTCKADVWALACILHVLITGYPAFEPNPWQCERMRYFKAYRESHRFRNQFSGGRIPDETIPEIIWGHSWMFMKHWGDDLKTILGRMLSLRADDRPSLEELLNFGWIRPVLKESSVIIPVQCAQEESETEADESEAGDSEEENNMNMSSSEETTTIFGSSGNTSEQSIQLSHSCANTPSSCINTEGTKILASPIKYLSAYSDSQDENTGSASSGSVSSHP
jgi:serine/threonine protein kinase